MSKIICDVCGTSYQESSTQCPICGCARPVDVMPKIASDDAKIVRRENYTYVKGGRFSKANVQKRNNGIIPPNKMKTKSSKAPVNPTNNKGDRGLIIALCVLLLAIIAVVIYIAIHFLGGSEPENYDQPTNHTTISQSAEVEDVTNSNISCVGIVLSDSEITMTYAGEECKLNATCTPHDTTDQLLFSTSDDAIVTISDIGNMVAVSPGEAIITVKCGDVSEQCRVVCSFDEDPADTTTEPIVDSTTFTAPFMINKTDVTIKVGETFQLMLTDANGEIIPVNWSPSVADICKIDGNSITGKMKKAGGVEISVTYEGETYTCIVRVK